MDSARTSKEMNFRSGSDREKLGEKGKAEFDFFEEEAKSEVAKETENYRRFFEQRVTETEDDMLKKPELAMNGPKMNLTIDGKAVEPPTVWAREDLSPQQARDLRKAAEQKVMRDYEAKLDQIEHTGEDKQRALLDRELGSHRYDRDRSYRDVGENGSARGHDREHPAATATRGAADLGGSALEAETVDDAYIKTVEAYEAEHNKDSNRPASGQGDDDRGDDLNFSGPDNFAPQLCEDSAYEWTPERIASLNELRDQHEAERAHDHDIDPNYS